MGFSKHRSWQSDEHLLRRACASLCLPSAEGPEADRSPFRHARFGSCGSFAQTPDRAAGGPPAPWKIPPAVFSPSGCDGPPALAPVWQQAVTDG
jgi:hypothetical protein